MAGRKTNESPIGKCLDIFNNKEEAYDRLLNDTESELMNRLLLNDDFKALLAEEGFKQPKGYNNEMNKNFVKLFFSNIEGYDSLRFLLNKDEAGIKLLDHYIKLRNTGKDNKENALNNTDTCLAKLREEVIED